jgi:hypothetical protein
MYAMFYYVHFSQDLSTWCVENVRTNADFDTGSDLTTDQLPVWNEVAESCPPNQ